MVCSITALFTKYFYIFAVNLTKICIQQLKLWRKMRGSFFFRSQCRNLRALHFMEQRDFKTVAWKWYCYTIIIVIIITTIIICVLALVLYVCRTFVKYRQSWCLRHIMQFLITSKMLPFHFTKHIHNIMTLLTTAAKTIRIVVNVPLTYCPYYLGEQMH